MGTTCTGGATSSSHAVSSPRWGVERIRNARSGFLRHPQCQLVSVILNISICVLQLLPFRTGHLHITTSGFYPTGYFGDGLTIIEHSAGVLTKSFSVNMKLTSRHLVHLFEC